MSDTESSIRTFALVDTAINAAIGSRWYIDHIPDNAVYPLVLMRQIANDDLYSQDGASGHVVTYQCEVYATTKAALNSTAAAIKARFAGYRGAMGDVDAGRVWCRITRGGFEPSTQKFWRVIEIELGTNE